MSELLHQLGGALLTAGGPLLGLTGVLLLVVRMGYDRFYGNRALLTWELVSDSGLKLVPDELEPGFTTSPPFSPQTQQELENASIVILKFRNAGTRLLNHDDFDQEHPVRFTFPDRTIKSCRVSTTDTSQDVLQQQIQNHFTVPEADRKASADPADSPPGWKSLVIPSMQLNRGDFFKLVVILAGTTPGVKSQGRLNNDWNIKEIVREARAFRFRGRGWQAGLALLLVGTTITLISVAVGLLQTADYCASGDLTIKGSSAFMPVAKNIGDSYTSVCRQAKVIPQVTGSLDGVRAVQLATGATRSGLATLSDGPAQSGTDGLDSKPVAVLIYSVVTNADVGIDNLRLDQLRDIYRGRYTNWRELGSPIDLPIRLVGRGGESGTRRAFEQQVLGFQEGPLSSDSCAQQDRDSRAPISLCERDTTQQVLDEVAATPGALGYADAPAASKRAGLTRVRMDGNEPTLDHVRRGYPFWTVEYLYTNGIPDQNSVLAKFIDYLISDSARVKLREAEYTPCISQDRSILDLCQHPHP